MRVTLILPPTDMRNCECFQLPNVSLPVLAGYLRARGVEVLQKDFDVFFHSRTRHERKDLDFKLLSDKRLILDYLHGRLPRAAAARVAAVEDALFGICPLEPSDLFGISLVDFKSDVLLNSSALLARRIRKAYKAPVVIGNSTLSKLIYGEILRDFPVFDYAVYSNCSEMALLRLARRVCRASDQPLAGLLERSPDGSVREHADFRDASVVIYPPDYGGYPLDAYRLDGAAILDRYNSDWPLFRKLRRSHGGLRQQIVLSRFETTCRGRCAFCRAPTANLASNRRGTAELLDEFSRLKDLGVTGVYFVNSQFNNGYEAAEALCDGMIRRRLGLQWADCVNFRELDEKLLDKMQASGAVKLTFGLETGSARLLRYIRKGVTKARASQLLRHSHALGIWNHIELIGGLPTETPRDLAETQEFLRAHAGVIDVHSLNPFYLYAGSPLHRAPSRFGIRLRRDDEGPRDHFDWDEDIGIVSERFDEVGGLRWEQKDVQIREATRTLARAIEGVDPPVGIDYIHINLLMFLYAVFGHKDKALIRKLMKVCTSRFKPYNLDFFMRPPSYEKDGFKRVARRKAA